MKDLAGFLMVLAAGFVGYVLFKKYQNGDFASKTSPKNVKDDYALEPRRLPTGPVKKNIAVETYAAPVAKPPTQIIKNPAPSNIVPMELDRRPPPKPVAPVAPPTKEMGGYTSLGGFNKDKFADQLKPMTASPIAPSAPKMSAPVLSAPMKPLAAPASSGSGMIKVTAIPGVIKSTSGITATLKAPVASSASGSSLGKLKL